MKDTIQRRLARSPQGTVSSDLPVVPTSSAPQRASRLGEVKPYYFVRKLKEIAQRRSAGEDIINLGIGNPDLAPPPGVHEALQRDMMRPQSHGYQPYGGTSAWREALGKWYAQIYDVSLSDEEIMPLAGSKEGIAHLAMAYLDKGQVMLVPSPGYPAYEAAARLAGAVAQGYRLPSAEETTQDWLIYMENLLETHDVRLLLVNSPHMPTGQLLSVTHMDGLIDIVRRHNSALSGLGQPGARTLIVSDNAYSYYHPAGPQSMLARPYAREVCVELNSLSKSHHMPGWRLGVLVGSAEVLRAAMQVKSNLDSGQYRPVMAGGVAALCVDDGWLRTRNEKISRRRAACTALLKRLGCKVDADQYGLFVWARLPQDSPSSEEWCDILLDETGVFVTPGTVFGKSGEGYVRASLCIDEDMLALALQRINKSSAL